MKIITKIDSLIKTLKELDSQEGNWIVYPKIGGFEVDCKIDNKSIEINDTLYCVNTSFKTNGYERVLIVPNSTCKWVNVDSAIGIDIQARKMLETDPLELLNNCYFYQIENGSLPKIPHYYKFSSIDEILNNLNSLDRNLRITDWFVTGLIIKKSEKSFLYIKPPLQAITKITKIEHIVNKSGSISAIVKFEPVNFNGILTVQTDILDDSFISSNKIEVGDLILIQIKRHGHKNTTLKSVIYPFNKKNRVFAIKKCPCCNSTLIKNEISEKLVCSNEFCADKLIKKIIHWCSKKSMDIKGLGGKTAKYLLENKILVNVDDIYLLSEKDLTKVPCVLDKMAKNILSNIKISRHKSLANVILSLNIDGVGKNLSLIVAWIIEDLENLLNILDNKDLSLYLRSDQINSIARYISKETNKEVIINLSRQLKPKKILLKNKNHEFYNKRIFIENKLNDDRKKAITLILMQAGIKVTDNIKNCDYYLYHRVKSGFRRKVKTIKLSSLLQSILEA